MEMDTFNTVFQIDEQNSKDFKTKLQDLLKLTSGNLKFKWLKF